jgi:hypothetical protein
MSGGQSDIPLRFDTHRRTGEQSIKQEEEERWHKVKDESDSQGAKKLDLKRGVRQNKSRPCHPKEEEIETRRKWDEKHRGRL